MMNETQNDNCLFKSICNSIKCPNEITDCYLVLFMSLLKDEIEDKNIIIDSSASLDSKRRAIIHIRRVFKEVIDAFDTITIGEPKYGIDDPRVFYLESQLWHYAPSMSADCLSDENLQHRNSKSDVLIINEGPKQDKGRLIEMIINLLKAISKTEETNDAEEQSENYENSGIDFFSDIGEALGG